MAFLDNEEMARCHFAEIQTDPKKETILVVGSRVVELVSSHHQRKCASEFISLANLWNLTMDKAIVQTVRRWKEAGSGRVPTALSRIHISKAQSIPRVTCILLARDIQFFPH